MKKHSRILTVLTLVILSATACLHKRGGTGVTAWERVHTYNATLATANETLEQGAEAAVSANLVLPIQAAPLIGWTGQVATVHQQVTAILAKGSATPADIAAVKALVDQIKASLASLPPIAVGVKNPKSQQTFQHDIENVGALADALLTSLEAIGGSQ